MSCVVSVKLNISSEAAVAEERRRWRGGVKTRRSRFAAALYLLNLILLNTRAPWPEMLPPGMRYVSYVHPDFERETDAKQQRVVGMVSVEVRMSLMLPCER